MIDVGPLEKFAEHTITIVDIEGLEIGIVRWDGELYALKNACPHEGGPVCRGRLGPKIIAGDTPGQLAVDDNQPVLTCCWHGWEFNARTGLVVWGKPGYRIKTYPVEVRENQVHIKIDATASNSTRSTSR